MVCFVPQKFCFVCSSVDASVAASTSRLSYKPRHSSFLMTFPGAMRRRRRGIFLTQLRDAAMERVLLRHLLQSLH